MLPGYRGCMQAAMVHESLIETRRKLGLDRFDEVWDGVLHMVPQPSTSHQSIESDLERALVSIVRSRGDLRVLHNLPVFDPAVAEYRDYRVPDIVVVDPRHLSKRGVEGDARLVVEILSPDDESREKLPFYAHAGVREVWLVDPMKRAIEARSAPDPRRRGGDVDRSRRPRVIRSPGRPRT